jgi:catechol-2,3-dioxygenase
MAAVRRLNHAVLYVTDAERAAAFYRDVLGFDVVVTFPGAAFLRASGSPNDHDLGLFGLGPDAHRARGRTVGLYHLAWQVDTIDELVAMRARLREVGSLVGESDHAVSKSLYAVDPDGNEFEVMWAVPRSAWTGKVGTFPLDLAAEERRWAGVSTLAEANVGG